MSDESRAARILVVEDNPKNLKLAVDVLTFSGYDVRAAETGELGVEAALSDRPDLILMDLQLPGIDGVEALQLIRGDHRSRGVPIVAVTAFASEEDRSSAFAAGFDGFLSKPLDIRSFPRQVQGFLDLGGTGEV
jgi:two-component system, cell cycle response regulator DivK